MPPSDPRSGRADGTDTSLETDEGSAGFSKQLGVDPDVSSVDKFFTGCVAWLAHQVELGATCAITPRFVRASVLEL